VARAAAAEAKPDRITELPVERLARLVKDTTAETQAHQTAPIVVGGEVAVISAQELRSYQRPLRAMEEKGLT
jgi:hypothetical protein